MPPIRSGGGRWILGLFAGVVLITSGAVMVARWWPHPPVKTTQVDQVETQLAPVAMRLTPDGTASRDIGVVFKWPRSGRCIGEFHAEAIETATVVRLGPVIDRVYIHGICAGVGNVGVLGWENVRLRAPLGERRVVRASDGGPLPVFEPTDRILPTNAVGARIAKYGGTPLALQTVATTTDRNAVQRLAHQLDLLAPYPWDDSYLTCAASGGSYYSIVFSYSTGGDMTVKFDPTGCQVLYIDQISRPAAFACFPGASAGCADQLGIVTILEKLLGP